jgi:predicted Zn-dependent peptidase
MELFSKEGSYTPLRTIQFERGSLQGMRVHVLPTKQFKTYAISVYIGQPLHESSVTGTALTPFVLRRGTERFPETKQFREHLDNMYGTGLGFDIYKRGDYQIVQFRMDVIEDQYVSSNEPLLAQALRFLGETLTHPATENDVFRTKYIDSEKVTLQKRIESIINDKIKYAAERCIEEMCKNEPYRLHPLGTIESLSAITADSLYKQYRDWLKKAPIDIYIVGNTTLDEVMPLLASGFAVERSDASTYSLRSSNPEVKEVNRVVEQLDVKQGKLNMGLRTYVTYGDDGAYVQWGIGRISSCQAIYECEGKG